MYPIRTMNGNDPEIFIKESNRVIPSEVILGDKRRKTVKVDNVAIELQPGPRECLQEQNKMIANSLNEVRKILDDRGNDSKVSLRPVELVREEDITKHESVCMFGCAPSLVFNGQDLNISRPNVDPRKVRYRSVGYHVHLGLDKPSKLIRDHFNENSGEVTASKILHTTEGRVRLVQICDLIVGLPAVLLERDNRVTLRRGKLGYGKAGEFREQPHGFEYRTLGSWPLFDPMWGWWANAAVRDALNIVTWDQDAAVKENIDLIAVSKVINTGDLAGALHFWQKVKENLRAILPSWKKVPYAHLPDSHPILNPNLIRYFDFLAMNQDLKGRVFAFARWCKRVDESIGMKPIAFYAGFPNRAKKKCEAHADWPAFKAAWSLDKDIISKPLSALCL